MRCYTVATFVFLCAARLGQAQAVVDPGMTRADVVAKLGTPAVERVTGPTLFLYYRNGVERRVGMNDVVILEDGKVTDAIFRSSARRYSGKSSSPAAVSAMEARRAVKNTGPLTVPAGTSSTPATARTTPMPARKLRPAEAAQAGDVAKPMPPAHSAIRDKEKAAAEKAAADKAAADAKKAAEPPPPPKPPTDASQHP